VSERTDALREWFPTPFVAIVVLLLVLIFLTPNLISSASPSAGSLPTEAELVIDRASSDNVTHLYVHGLGEVRYDSIALSVDPTVLWPPPAAPSNLSFGPMTVWRNTLVATVDVAADPFAVNVSAVYVDASGATVDFVGTFAFEVSGGSLLEVAYVPAIGGVTTTPVSGLPLSVLLQTVTGGGST
jgi:hypothetical protein